MEKRFDVIALENPIMDFAISIDHIPGTDSMAKLFDYMWQGGGNASNAIVALARLGARTAYIGVAGDDECGTFCKDDFARHGIDVSHLYQYPGPNTVTFCLAEKETKGRSFLGKVGVDQELTDEQIDEAFIASSKYLHTSMIDSVNKHKAIEFARKNGVIVSMDGGAWDDEEGPYAIANSDILIISEDFYKAIYGDDDNFIENCKKLLEKGPEIVIVTLGSKGCAGADKNGETFQIPSFSGYTIVDTTGAGDVYHGGFLYAHNQGWGLEKCARFASAVSYINCTTLGGRVGIPTLEMVERFLDEGVIHYIDIDERREFYKNVMTFRKGDITL